ncbi:hypothetical protein VM98_09010 [Streptomyces rubellomurinus subsp. indigoferus]|nr:hypothetical protein VM98_09010 [Streptomyces rubellomurinus subsp. indigoferus]
MQALLLPFAAPASATVGDHTSGRGPNRTDASVTRPDIGGTSAGGRSPAREAGLRPLRIRQTA